MQNTARTRDDLHELAKLVEDARVIMLTTTSDDGALHSKPMTVLEFDGDGCFWFLCEHDPSDVDGARRFERVNIAVSDENKSTFVSIEGRGALSHDHRLRHQLWTRMAKPWFPDGPDSPLLAVLKITPSRAEFWDAPDSRLARGLAMAASIVAGKPVGMGSHGVLHPNEPSAGGSST